MMANNHDKTSLNYFQTGLRRFVQIKSTFSPSHEYAIVTLTDRASWFAPLTNNVQATVKAIHSIVPKSEPCTSFDMRSVYETVAANIPPPTRVDNSWSYVVRVIVLYARSATIPHFSGGEQASASVHRPWLFCDYVLLHRRHEHAQSIFDSFFEFNKIAQPSQYYFEVHLARKFYTALCLLLGHALQRPSQLMQAKQTEQSSMSEPLPVAASQEPSMQNSRAHSVENLTTLPTEAPGQAMDTAPLGHQHPHQPISQGMQMLPTEEPATVHQHQLQSQAALFGGANFSEADQHLSEELRATSYEAPQTEANNLQPQQQESLMVLESPPPAPAAAAAAMPMQFINPAALAMLQRQQQSGN
ncbi:hypothetical protein, variant 1 [Capsaspora owczarzaki ATCC 30864]|nr:hypothetical protein, variant 1 [Capsaspora owczarzaki ATCC 30864]